MRRARSRGIIIHYTRPSLPIRGGEPDPADDPAWTAALSAARPWLRRAIAGVGRLQSRDLGPAPALGTAWLVRADIAVTNAHVTRSFTARLRSGAVAVAVDFLAEIDDERPGRRDRELPRRVLDVLYEAEDHDLAFLRLAPADAAPSPSATTGSLALADAIVGRDVAVVGYPSRSVAHYDPAQIDRMFADRFDVKRLAPGRLIGASITRVDHDCTTLGGNSGSPLLDLERGAVVGVHYGGEGRFLVNWAVPAGVVAARLAALTDARA